MSSGLALISIFVLAVFVGFEVVIIGNWDVVGYIMFVYVSNGTIGMSFVCYL